MLSQCNFIELPDTHKKTQKGELKLNSLTDRIYFNPASRLAIEDPVWQRFIYLETQGSRSAVVWNPWEKSKPLSQFSHDGWKGMLCLETANAFDDARTLSPQEKHTLELTLWSEPFK